MTTLSIVAALALTVGVASASAHKKKTPRQTTLVFEDLPEATGDRLSGQVSLGAPPEEPLDPGGEPLAAVAAKGNCLANQPVVIRHTPTFPGGGHAGPTTVVANTVTDANGFWQTTAYEASGANQLLFDGFQVEIVKKRLPPKSGRHKHVCLGAFARKTPFSY